jgi:hypothetical protein
VRYLNQQRADNMVMEVEIELQIPALTIEKEYGLKGRIDNAHVRFRKVVVVPGCPPVGSQIAVSIRPDLNFECTIARADWHEEKQRFVLACKYPKRRLFPEEYDKLLNDDQWERTEQEQR